MAGFTWLLVVAAAVPRPASVEQLLVQAKASFDGLEYERVIPVADEVLRRAEATPDQRLDAYLLQGSCSAILGRTIDAEVAFTRLLRGRPDFDVPKSTPPKILAVFRKVQADEREFAALMKERERRRSIAEMEIVPVEPSEPVGGRPIKFEYRIRDPRGLIDQANFHYRRVGEARYSILSLKQDAQSGAWQGELPSEWTSSESGFLLEYLVSTMGADNSQLVGLGTEAAPRQLQLLPGQMIEETPFYGSVWFWTAIGAIVAGGVATTVVLVSNGSGLPETDLGEVPFR